MLISILLIQGFLIGLAVAAPVGPVGILCIRSTLERGLVPGLAVGLGAALADTAYGGVAAFGLTFVTSFLQHYSIPLRLIGSLILFYMAWRIIRQNGVAGTVATAAENASLLSTFAGTFFLTLTNPATLISFMVIFAGLGLLTGISTAQAALMVFCVFLGSLSWWVFLSLSVMFARARMNETVIRKINTLSGTLIAVFGVVILLSVLKGRLI